MSRPSRLTPYIFVILSALILPVRAHAQTASNWTYCANEGGYCAFAGTQQVRYGANGVYVYKTLTGGTACTNSVFGDPIYGVAKHCDVAATATSPSSGWTFCASEGGYCAFSGTQQVRYGANGVYVYKTLTGGTACSNSVFGDPIFGVAKQCDVGGAATSTDWTFCALEGGYCGFSGTQQVRYGGNGVYVYKTLTGGTACSNSVFGDPIYGVAKQCDIGGTATAPAPAPSPSPTSVGPQSTITCPSGAVSIYPGTSIQTMVNQYAAGTTFCIRSGVFYLSSAITPKSGDTFVGEYGAILDGTGWSTTDPNQGAFRAHNEDIDDVTIRNLVIRSMPQRAIHAYRDASDRWTVEYNELASSQIGINAPNNSLIRNNYIHHNANGGYAAYRSANTVFEGNEIAYNSGKQKVLGATNMTFRNNFVHHNPEDGIWYDSSGGGLVEGNVVEDTGRDGISAESTTNVVIRNNTVRRSANSGIFISMSQGIEAYSNTTVGNFRAIQLFLNCDALQWGTLDLANNSVHDNSVTVGTDAGAQANTLTYSSICTSTQIAPYLNGSKNLKFVRNSYYVPSLTTKYFVWGFGSAGLKSWSEWQSLGNDLTGVIQLW